MTPDDIDLQKTMLFADVLFIAKENSLSSRMGYFNNKTTNINY